MIVMKPLLPDDIRKSSHKAIVDAVKKLGGSVEDVDVWGKRYLAYEIKKHTEGYYIVYTFKLEPSKVAELSRQLHLRQEILRFLVSEVKNLDGIKKQIKKKQIELE